MEAAFGGIEKKFLAKPAENAKRNYINNYFFFAPLRLVLASLREIFFFSQSPQRTQREVEKELKL
jgi:hypothetical protein